MRRILVRIALGLLILVVVLVAGGYVYLRQSLPSMSGSVSVPGISAPVEIVRDADAIPHVFGATKQDALFGLGYVHAQDRLWQMEFQRRIGHGRLSEVFGTATIPQDRFLRTVGFGRAAASAWAHLPTDIQEQVNAYVAGINAFIASHHGSSLPPEFTLLRFEPEPFSGPDVVVWVKMMAWDLSANYSFEMMRHDILSVVGAERLAELTPPYPVDGLSIVSTPLFTSPGSDARAIRPAPLPLRPTDLARSADATGVRQPSGMSAALAAALSTGSSAVRDFLLTGGRTEALGSNSWAVDGTLTASGKPLLANDPHLGTHVPSLWYLAHVSAGDFEIAGATIPGAPAVAIGRNRFIAWGETNVAADVQDLFLERLSADGTTAEFMGTQEPVRVIPEVIKVSGGEPITLNVRVTRHGPLVSDAINANNAASTATPKPPTLEPLAFRWTALEEADSTLTAFMRLNEARNWADFTSALRAFVVPSQNFLYADVDGHIGYYAPARIPIRATGDGSRPVPGWSGEYEWTGYVPFEELPHTFDPPEHMIVTANHRPMPAEYPHLIGLEFPDPYRAQRVTDMLRGRSQLTSDDFRAMQADTMSLHAKALLPMLLPNVQSRAATTVQALDVLRAWNFDASGDSAASAIFQAWFLRLAPALAGDELGPRALDGYAGRFSYVTRFTQDVLAAGNSPWCDDARTPATESCDQTITKALEDGLADLTTRLGGDMTTWRWDSVHRAVFPHQGLDAVGALRPILSRSMPNGGDWSSVNVGPVAADTLYDQESVPGYRQIIDLSPANDSRFQIDVGQSGHFLSRHYDDYLPAWQTVQHKKLRMDRASIDSGAMGRLVLQPSTSN